LIHFLKPEPQEEIALPRFAVRPNAGKSSFINAFGGKDILLIMQVLPVILLIKFTFGFEFN
jgi:predicted GTPase